MRMSFVFFWHSLFKQRDSWNEVNGSRLRARHHGEALGLSKLHLISRVEIFLEAHFRPWSRVSQRGKPWKLWKAMKIDWKFGWFLIDFHWFRVTFVHFNSLYIRSFFFELLSHDLAFQCYFNDMKGISAQGAAVLGATLRAREFAGEKGRNLIKSWWNLMKYHEIWWKADEICVIFKVQWVWTELLHLCWGSRGHAGLGGKARLSQSQQGVLLHETKMKLSEAHATALQHNEGITWQRLLHTSGALLWLFL